MAIEKQNHAVKVSSATTVFWASDAAVPGLGAALGLWTMPRLGPDCESLGKDHRSMASNLVRVGAARG